MTKALRTIAEESGFRLTGRIEEVERLCAGFAQQWPQAVRSFEYGRSGEGRAMRALIVSRCGALSAQELKRLNTPVLMLQGGIHPGESDGKDAGFIALRELLESAAAPARSIASPFCLCRRSTPMDMNARVSGTAPIRSGRKKPAGARPRKT